MATQATPLFLSQAETDDFLEPESCIEVTREAYTDRGNGGDAAPRLSLRRDEPAGKLDSYFALLPREQIMGGYVYAAGFTSGGPWFLTPLFDAHTGEPLALIDGGGMNAIKTAASGAVGIDALARTDAETLALFGSGGQAAAQLQCASVVRDLTDVRVYSPTPENRESFASQFDDQLDATVTAVDSPDAALDSAGIVITATRSDEPVFDGERLEPGTHITAMGQYSPYSRELDVETVARARYVPDLRARASQDAGSFLAAKDAGTVTDAHIHAELGDVLAEKTPGRTDDDQITVFDSGGTGIETVAVANMLYQRAQAAGVGQELTMEPLTY